MSHIYNYYKETANLGLLLSEIESSSIASIVQGISPLDDNTIDIIFESSLSASDATTLSSLVTNHSGIIPPSLDNVIFNNSFGNSEGTPLRSKNTSFKRVRSFIFKGTDYWGLSPAEVKFGVYVGVNGETGTIRLYDKTNDIVLGTITTTATNEEIVEMVCSSWPAGEATIEVHIKTSKKRVYVYCTSITILG